MFGYVSAEDFLALWHDIKYWYAARRARRLVDFIRLSEKSGQEAEANAKAPYHWHQQLVDRISLLDTWCHEASELAEHSIVLCKSPLLSIADKERLIAATAALFAQAIMRDGLRVRLEKQAKQL